MPRIQTIPVSGSEKGEKCISASEAMDKDLTDGIVWRLPLHIDFDFDTTNVRVQEQQVSFVETGCTGEVSCRLQEGYTPAPCPEDKASRCGQCIMNLVQK